MGLGYLARLSSLRHASGCRPADRGIQAISAAAKAGGIQSGCRAAANAGSEQQRLSLDRILLGCPRAGPRFQGDEIWARKTKSYLTAEPATAPKQPKADVIALIGYFRLWTPTATHSDEKTPAAGHAAIRLLDLASNLMSDVAEIASEVSSLIENYTR